MYQMFSYQKNVEAKGEAYKNSTGILLYPQVDKALDNIYKLEDHKLKICTVNLNDDQQNDYQRQ